MFTILFQSLQATFKDIKKDPSTFVAGFVFGAIFFLIGLDFYFAPCANNMQDFCNTCIFLFFLMSVLLVFLLPVFSFIDNYKEITRKRK